MPFPVEALEEEHPRVYCPLTVPLSLTTQSFAYIRPFGAAVERLSTEFVRNVKDITGPVQGRYTGVKTVTPVILSDVQN